MLESPCVKVCRLDADSICVGCGRSLAEIAAWARLNDAEQRVVRANAAKRLAHTRPDPARTS